MTNRTMLDAADLANIAKDIDVQMIAFYINGRYGVSDATVEALFPADKYRLVPIDVTGANANKARVLDVEKGDASPATAAEWIQSFKLVNPSYKSGGRPVIYCDRDTIASVNVQAANAGQKLARDYYLWVSTLDGTEYTGTGVIACQTKTITGSDGKQLYDTSVVYSAEWLPGVGLA